MYKYLLLFFSFTLSLQSSSQQPFFSLLDSLFANKEIRESKLLEITVKAALPADFVMPANVDVIGNIKLIAYYHLLLTSSNCTGGNVYGALKIPYFWNYGITNPRDSIYLLSKNKPLRNLKAPQGFEKYQSFASVDRTPFLFWKDMAETNDVYQWGDLKFSSFGWCSEREMAFKAWLNLRGIKSTVCFKGVHVWNEITLKYLPGYILKVDNTFNQFQLLPDSMKTEIDSADKYLKWYNAQGASSTNKQLLSSISNTKLKAALLRQMIHSFFVEN